MPASSPSTSSSPKQRIISKACANCRRKKVRCDLSKPACHNCQHVYRVECVYDASLSHRSAEALQQRLVRAERLLDMLSSDPSSLPSVLSQWSLIRAGATTNSVSPLSPSTTVDDATHSTLSRALPLPTSTSKLLSFASKTSSSPQQPSAEDVEQLEFMRQLPVDLIDHLQYIHWSWQWPLHLFVDKEATIKDLAAIRTAQPHYASSLLLLTLLAHAARFSSRVVVQTSSSNDQYKLGGIFLTRAKQLLYKQLDRAPNVADTAAILMLASREVACGNFSQSWVYSGIAFRMLEHMGIPALASSIAAVSSMEEYAGILQDDNVRRAWRLYWSCFTFDKTLSFGLGRKPSLRWGSELQNVHLGDEESQQSAPCWPEFPPSPPTAAAFDRHGQQPPSRSSHYPYQTFSQWCTLSAVLGEILELKSISPNGILSNRLRAKELSQRLMRWKEQLPAHLGVNHCSIESQTRSPPPNIMTINIVYQVCRILLHSGSRTTPFAASEQQMRIETLVSPSSHGNGIASGGITGEEAGVCTSAAIAIHSLLELWSRSFSFDRMTWLIGSCIYTAAIVNAQDARHPDADFARAAAARLNFAVYALGISASFTPGIRKSTSALLEYAEKVNLEHRMHGGSNCYHEPTPTSSSYTGATSKSVPVSCIGPHHSSPDKVLPVATTAKRRRSAQQADPPKRLVARHTTQVPPLQQDTYEGAYDLASIDLESMFSDVMQAQPSSTEYDEPAYTTTTSGYLSTTSPYTTAGTHTDSGGSGGALDAWINYGDGSHWDLDAIINDTAFLDALGSLPLYPSDNI